jgi:hypothetical protein
LLLGSDTLEKSGRMTFLPQYSAGWEYAVKKLTLQAGWLLLQTCATGMQTAAGPSTFP